MRKIKRKWNFDSRSFCYGAAAALLMIIIFAATAAFSVWEGGITVKIDSEQIALLIQEQVTTNTSRELPEIIAGAKEEIPHIVREKIEFNFSDRMEIAGFVFRVPEELLTQLQRSMQQNVEKATGMILDGINTEELAEQMGNDFYTAVKSTLQDEMEKQNLQILLWGVVPVNVRILIT